MEIRLDELIKVGMTLLEAVKKQEPQKPIECTDVYPPGQYECPVCRYCVGHHKSSRYTPFGEIMVDAKVEFMYCPCCGQKLDWGEAHE